MNPDDVVLISSSSDEEEEEDDVILISDDDDDDDCIELDVNKEDYDVIELMDSDDEEDKPADHVPRGIHNQGGNNSAELSTFEIKSYLRKHGMRLSGTKEECMERIKENERLKDGGGESLNPISSFSINCTGDACKGDVVLFRQNIKNGIKLVGTRTVAGRIVTESYGASCQQHTFTVEVLWSKRYKKLDPLSILLVKGRYLYKYGTFRQPWESEAERLIVLGEKHSRGDAARRKRKLRQTGFASRNDRGRKCRNVSDKGQCKSKQPTQIDKQTSSKKKGKAHVKESTSANKKKVVPAMFQKMKFKRSARLRFRRHPNLNPTRYRISDHHQQEASSSFPCDRTLVPYGHHNNGEREANHVFNQPPGYHHHNYQQPVPRLKDGGGESLNPISSFSINCTGDACKGDVVLFRQNIKNGIKLVGTRTVAGRIVTESYGASCQQHTFTVEVLWSKRYKKLDPLSILLVKGRYLYKYGTFRQPWESEAERLIVLGEKHSRGDAARRKRKLRQTGFASRNDRGRKCRNVSDKGQCKSKQPTQIDKQTSSKKKGKAHVKESTSANKKKVVPAMFQKMKFKRSARLRFRRHPNLNPTRYRISDHHQQEASSSFPCDRTLVPYGHHNNGEREANHVFNQPPGYHHHNYQQPVPRFKSLYPRSSFSIDCTGDACEGDVVFFKLDVYKRQKILAKQGTIVGRIVKDICLAPKRHDFMIEVLWFKGSLYLSPLSVVVVKDWNVYRFGTLRQPWENEAARSEVLREKHRLAEAANNKYKRKLRKTDITSSINAGIKRQKVPRKGSSRNIQPTKQDKHKSSRERAAAFVKARIKAHKRKGVRFEKTELKRSTEPTFCPDLNPDLNPNPDSNLNANPDSNLKPKANLNVNPNSNLNLNPDPNINSNPTPNLNLKPNSNSNLNLNQMQKPKPNPTQKPKPNPKQKPNSNLKPNKKQKPKPNLKREPKLNPTSNPNPNPYMNSNLNLYPYPNDHHPQEASSSFPNDRTLLPNFPPHGFPPNLSPLGFPHNQPTFGLMPHQPPHGFIHNMPPYEFSGFGGQWGPNHVFCLSPDYYHQLATVQLALAILAMYITTN